MYEALAWSIEINRGSAADIEKSLNFAADLAQRSRNPNQLFSAADKLFIKGYLKRVGPLLDETIKAVPHRFEPLVMSIDLAQKTKDPIRMADSIDRLLSLGWPGRDDYFRIEAGNQVDTLARALKAEDRVKEAESLQTKLTASLARDLFVRLTWDGYADFDVVVDEPLGATASFDTPRTVFGGSVIKNGYGSHPDDIYVCPCVQRQVHDSRENDLDRPQETGHAPHTGDDHPRGDHQRKEGDPQPVARQVQQARDRLGIRGKANHGSPVCGSARGDLSGRPASPQAEAVECLEERGPRQARPLRQGQADRPDRRDRQGEALTGIGGQGW